MSAPETRPERRALYDALRRERYGPISRLRRELPKRSRPNEEDPAVLAQRVRDLLEAVADEEI